MTTADPDRVRDEVRAKYAAAAIAVTADSDGCCGSSSGCGTSACCDTSAAAAFGSDLYGDADRAALPADALTASLGCGTPLAVADLAEGETVLDLGSGGGIDVLLSARRVGPAGRAYGLDMTDEMLDLARRNAASAGATNVQFLKGRIEDIPLPDATVDVVISNCVINLSPEKEAVFREVRRVLRPGGRIGISDVVAEDRLDTAARAERGSHVGCIAGALSKGEYERLLGEAGFGDVSVTFTHEVADGMHGAIVKARRPADQQAAASMTAATGPAVP
jgi:arsenite methyltransferase